MSRRLLAGASRVSERFLADLENGEAAIVTSSGMAAISAAMLAVASGGDHVLAQQGLYGGTHGLLTRLLPGFGIEHDVFELGFRIECDVLGLWL